MLAWFIVVALAGLVLGLVFGVALGSALTRSNYAHLMVSQSSKAYRHTDGGYYQ
jgi:ABC-type nitrate/sulfonate/bicarbonate transport system permease component